MEHAIEVFQPESLLEKENLPQLTQVNWDLFVVVAYSKILPAWLIEMPMHKTLNLHPSLLPKLRGASPIRTALLNDLDAIGVTIMLMDEKMDHGPILAQESVPIMSPVPGRALDKKLAEVGGTLLIHTIPQWIAREITPREQNHEDATFSQKISKDMGELSINPHLLPTGDEAYQMYRKICAFDGWPGTFFIYNNKRVKITDAKLSENDTLEIVRVIPEGKKECPFETYLKSL
jgi:methionyl-tRNA formyltransferase